MAIIGYARVSTTDQNPQLQLDALLEAGAKRVFTDYGVSGASASRPHLAACLDHLREGECSPSGSSTASGATPNTFSR